MARIRARLRLRQRFRSRTFLKDEAELGWWLGQWEPVLRAGGFHPGDALELLDGEPRADTYEGRRWQQARAEVRRVMQEACIDDPTFFDGKVVVDMGPGALGFPDACPARVSIGIDPLAQRFADAGLLLRSHAVYLAARAESVPLVSGSADVILARNSLDHVESPSAVIREARRLLCPGGTLILNFDVDHTPTAAEPHALEAQQVRSWLNGMTIVTEQARGQAHGADGQAVVLVARQPSS